MQFSDEKRVSLATKPTFGPKFVKNSRIFDRNSTNFSKKLKTQAKVPENSTKLPKKLKVPEVFKTGYPTKIAQKKPDICFCVQTDVVCVCELNPLSYK